MRKHILSLQPAMGIYIHLPYCVKKCPYCDFNSYDKDFAFEQYTTALNQEIRNAYNKHKDTLDSITIESIFFGGGTPSLFSIECLKQIFGTLRDCFQITEHSEITLECNPGTLKEALGAEKLVNFKSLGINRLSFGVQSFSDEKLHKLGRIHSGQDAENVIKLARRVGFRNINLDLMFGIMDESLELWKSDLQKAIFLEPNHISAYSLMYEGKTPFAKDFKLGKLKYLDDELLVKFFETTENYLSDAGYNRYEISNYAQSGYECKHNLIYWSTGNYFGFGAGAHSNLSPQNENNVSEIISIRSANVANPKSYIKALSKGESVVAWSEDITLEKYKLEVILLGLRKVRGIETKYFRELFRADENVELFKLLESYKQYGLMGESTEYIYLTSKGLLLADKVIEDLASKV